MIWPELTQIDTNRNRETYHGDTEARRGRLPKSPELPKLPGLRGRTKFRLLIWDSCRDKGSLAKLGISERSNSLLQRRWRQNGFDFHAQDAVAVHLQDGVAAAVEFKALAAFGNFAQLRHDESGQGFKAFFARQKDVVLGFQVAQIEAAVEHHGA